MNIGQRALFLWIFILLILIFLVIYLDGGLDREPLVFFVLLWILDAFALAFIAFRFFRYYNLCGFHDESPLASFPVMNVRQAAYATALVISKLTFEIVLCIRLRHKAIDIIWVMLPLWVDCLVLELEDGVALTAKEEARQKITQYLDSLPSKKKHKCFELGVRVNSVSSGLLYDDLKELSKAKYLPQAFMVPKVDSPEDLATIFDAFRTSFGTDRIVDNPTRLVIWIESPRGLLDIPRILNTTVNLHRNSGFFKLDAVVFGSDDYCAAIGASRSKEGYETLYARQRFVAACKAFNLQAIDSVYIDIKDLDGLRKSSEEGKAWGFDGKQCIHPSQIPVIQQAYAPPPEKTRWARELIDEFVRHEQTGKGAFVFHGQMIDKPLLLQAMNIRRIAELLDEQHKS